MQRARLKAHPLLRQHLRQVGVDGLGGHGAQIELQTAREHRDRHLLRVGGGQHELEVLGRLLERLEHGVERRVREHVHFVDHEDLEAPLDRFVDRLLKQLLNLVHASVGGGVQLGVIDKAAGIDVATGLANATGLGRDAALPVRALAVERLGQHARDRGLAHPPGAGEQVSVVQALLRERVGQGLHHVLLPHHFGEGAGAVFAGQDQVRHAGILSAARPHAWKNSAPAQRERQALAYNRR